MLCIVNLYMISYIIMTNCWEINDYGGAFCSKSSEDLLSKLSCIINIKR